ncbi:MAG: peptidase MA family metallohydrolase [Deltaproteobacteria bacterium]
MTPLVLLAALSLSQAAPSSGLKMEFEEAEARLESWDLPAAEKLAQDMAARFGKGAATDEMLGRVRFYEGDYAGAVALLEHSQSEVARLAKASLEELRGYDERASAHFVVRFPKGKDEILAGYALDTLELAYDRIGQDLGLFPKEKVRVEILRDPAALSRLSPLTEKEIHASGTIALCKFNKLMVTSPRALVTGYAWQDTLAHEFTHYLVTQRSDDTVPIWLHEGIAKFEESRWRGDAGLALSPAAKALLARRLRENRLITFAQMHPSMALLPNQEDATLAFAEVFTAIEFLYRAHGGKRALQTLLDELRAGKSDEAAVADVTGEPFSSFQRDWKAYLRQRPMPSELLPLSQERLRFKDASSARPRQRADEPDYGELAEIDDPAARRFAHLGELLHARKRIEAAIVEYGKASQRIGARSPSLSNVYALALLSDGKPAEAERVLRASLVPFPQVAQTHLHLAEVLLVAKRWRDARAELLSANAIDPFDPAIHLGLAQADRSLEDAKGAEAEAQIAALLRKN